MFAEGPIVTDTVRLKFPIKEWPDFAVYDGIWATIMDGNLEGFKIVTNGFSQIEKTSSILNEKYGKPSATTTEKAQNRFGASYEYSNAIWQFENLTVTHLGVLNKLDEGLVRIECDKARERREKFETSKDAIKRKL